MKDFQIVGLGMAVLDVLVRLKDLPTWKRLTNISGFRLEDGGLVATAMVAAAKLGARVGYVGTAGTDEVTELKLRSMVETGVDLSRMVRRPGPENEVAIVFVQPETGEQVFATSGTIRAKPVRVEELDRGYITAAEYLHLDGFHFDAALQAARWMKEAGKTVAIDASTRV